VSDATPSRPSSRYGAWIPGLALIGLGVVFLIQNYLGREIHNWWALFILIPVFFTLERGYASLQAGRSAEAIGQLMGGLVLVALIVIFLFDLPFGQLWPIFLIIGGLSLLFSRRIWTT
jgi:cell wall-active antibiotic response 4TMS protein YvqF